MKSECSAAQARLDVLLVGAAPATADKSARTEARQGFLDCPELGPDPQGLLRVLHELSNAVGTNTKKTAQLRPRHLRVPCCNESRAQALLLWRAFLRGAIPESLPLILVSRNGADWIDVIIGEALTDHFFCLQAAPKALPLASAIPYELSPELKPRLQVLETKFLGNTAPPVPMKSGDAPSPVPRAEGGAGGRPSSAFLAAAALAVVAAAAAWYWAARRPSPGGGALAHTASGSVSNARPAQAAAVSPTVASTTAVAQNQQRAQRFADSVAAGKKALEQKNYSAAVPFFTNALALVPEDAETKELLRKAEDSRQPSEVHGRFLQ